MSTAPPAPVTSNGEVSVANASAPGLLLISTALAPTAQAALPAKSKEPVPEALSSSIQAESTPVPVDDFKMALPIVAAERSLPMVASDGNMPEGSSLAQPTTAVQEGHAVGIHHADPPIASGSGQAVAAVPPPVQPAPGDQTTDGERRTHLCTLCIRSQNDAVARETAAVFDRLRAREADRRYAMEIMRAAVMHVLSLANLDELTELLDERAARQ